MKKAVCIYSKSVYFAFFNSFSNLSSIRYQWIFLLLFWEFKQGFIICRHFITRMKNIMSSMQCSEHWWSELIPYTGLRIQFQIGNCTSVTRILEIFAFLLKCFYNLYHSDFFGLFQTHPPPCVIWCTGYDPPPSPVLRDNFNFTKKNLAF